MKYEVNSTGKILWLALIPALFMISKPLFSQADVEQDTTIRLSRGSLVQIKNIKSFITTDTTIGINGSLIAGSNWRNDRTIAFYDSLKIKTSRSRITKALFDLVIVTPDSTDKTKIVNESDREFRDFSGIRIRNIEIKRLNTFGSDISNPGLYSPSGIEKMMNGTHINTNENIIRKNLLFQEGDSISPLRLTDNERILRQLPFIQDARIIIVPVSDNEADIIVITKDVYSIGAELSYRSLDKWSVWLFDKNIFGMGHEFKIEIPYSSGISSSPGIGLSYNVNNIRKSFINLNLDYYNALGIRSYGLDLNRKLISSDTKYAGGVSLMETHTSEDLDTMPEPVPLEYTFQDYWLMRSIMVHRESVSRIIAGVRYVNNNIYNRPTISPREYYRLQQYRLYLASLTFSVQKYYKTKLVYNYGTTEDFPYGGMLRITGGIEDNEFKRRTYGSIDGSFASSLSTVGYVHFSAGIGTFFSEGLREQGVLAIKLKYVTNLGRIGNQMIRSFINVDYTRGFNRYDDEYLQVRRENGFTGFFNDSTIGGQRVNLGVESVVFSSINFYGFKFAFFGFADGVFLAGTNELLSKGYILTGLGVGIRIRNNNLVFNTFQVRIGYFPSPPPYTRTSNVLISGEQLLQPKNFDPGPPAVLPYR